MNDKAKTIGCIGGILLTLTTSAVTSLVQAIRMIGVIQYFWAFMTVWTVVCLTLVVSGLVLNHRTLVRLEKQLNMLHAESER
jgi:cellulase/cellobiase CelA1